jgi:hypothetical protein
MPYFIPLKRIHIDFDLSVVRDINPNKKQASATEQNSCAAEYPWQRPTMRGKAAVLCVLWLGLASAWEASNLVGIWKLVSNALPHRQPTILDCAPKHGSASLSRSAAKTTRDEILLKINSDGTFLQCNEGYTEGSWIAGRWALVDDRRLTFAFNRQYYGPPFDIALDGNLRRERGALISSGRVCKGKFVLPRADSNFFQEGLQEAEALGSFRLVKRVAAVTESVSPAFDGALFDCEDDDAFQ